jgi:D-glycero-alpha-D-manno-heptose 1-phosphate guanylyltransferase
MEAIILAGGLGTRIKHLLGDKPKPMANIAGKPFLEYILEYLSKNNFKKIVLSVGYLGELVENHFASTYCRMEIEYCYEKSPLGTGGAISLALENSSLVNNEIFILNGDTFFEFNPIKYINLLKSNNSDIILGLKQINNPHRYGTVELNDENKIIKFREKRKLDEGLINCGVYLIKKELLDNYKLSKKYSFENDFLELYLDKLNAFGIIENGYFIDIGVEEDFLKAQKDFTRSIP